MAYNWNNPDVRKAILILDITRLISFSPLLLDYVHSRIQDNKYEQREVENGVSLLYEKPIETNTIPLCNPSITIDYVVTSRTFDYTYSSHTLE